MGGEFLTPSCSATLRITGGYIRRLLRSQYACNGIALLKCGYVIANGCEWEDSFEPFFWYSFHYSMWCKMNLFYEQATQDFQKENIVAPRQVKSLFDYLPQTFTRKQFQDAVLKSGYKTDSSTMLSIFKRRRKVVQNEDDTFLVV